MYVGFALLALQLGRVRDLSIADGKRLIAGLQRAARPDRGGARPSESELAEVAERLAAAESLFFVGRVRGYPVAREGAQKFKEITYRHAEAYQTSELKHGPLALISPERADGGDRARRRADRPQRRLPCTRSPPAAARSWWSPTPASTWASWPTRSCGSTYRATSASSTRSC